ncbi:MAG: right-handed parallel beta-helix repeat-containing protein [Acidimicrobiales bacterium]
MKTRLAHRGTLVLTMCLLALIAANCSSSPRSSATSTSGPVLLVGDYHGIKGGFTTIQAAVNAAQPGDWILVAPGDYHASPSKAIGVLVTKPNIHIRGMNRNTVIIDGTRPSAPGTCSNAASYQNLGPNNLGRDGIVVYKASGVSIQNLTACNFLAGSPTTGNGSQIYFDGGAGSRRIGLGSFTASYVTATSTFAGTGSASLRHLSETGVAARNVAGPAVVSYSFASNMASASFYVGACSNCNVTLAHVVAKNSVLGFSSTNAGGNLIVEDSLFAENKTGAVLASKNNADAPPPQNGACAHGKFGPRHTHSCTILENNLVLSNNNPNVPGGVDAGTYSVIGAGIVIAGGRNDLIYHNVVASNGSWGILLLDFPYQGKPPRGSHCQKGTRLPSDICVFPAVGDEVTGNVVSANGTFANPTNSDLAEATLTSSPGNCWTANTTDSANTAPTSDPPAIQLSHGSCSGSPETGNLASPLGFELACATQSLGPCNGVGAANVLAQLTTLMDLLHASTVSLNAPGTVTAPVNYPVLTQAVAPYPASQPTMPNPCSGVPANPWCQRKQ